MRFVVFVCGLLASLLTAAGGMGILFFDDAVPLALEHLPADTIDTSKTVSLTGIPHGNAGLIVVLAGAFGFLGSLFVVCRCGWQGGALMLIPALGAAAVNPLSLLFSSLQILVALMSFFVAPLPSAPAKSPS